MLQLLSVFLALKEHGQLMERVRALIAIQDIGQIQVQALVRCAL